MEEVSTVTENNGFKNPYSFVLKTMYRKKRFIFLMMLIFLVLGIVYSSLAKKEYNANAMVLPQISSSKGLSKKYSKIASLVGLNIGGEESTSIVPTLYPVFVNNLYFQRELLQANVKNSKTTDSITYGAYINKYYDEGSIPVIKSYTLGLPGKAINLFKSKPKGPQRELDSDINTLTGEERKQIGVMSKQIKINFDELDGVININVTSYDPILSEQLVKRCEEILQRTIINLSIEKSRNDLDFLEKRLLIVKEDYTLKRGALGKFKDRNKYALTSYTKNVEEQLKGEYELSFDIYSQIASQLESVKLQITKDTPIFAIIKPPVVPNESTSLSNLIVLIISLFLGFVLGTFLVVFFAFKPIIIDYAKSELSKA
jgi:uncharacterized protein involved in exopolysaccharide biosynthesis